MKKICIAAAVLFVLTGGAAWARGLVASPSQIGLVGKPGQEVTASITVASSRQQENDIRVSLADFSRTEEGSMKILAGRAHERSCREWLSVSQNQFVSPSHGAVELKVLAKIPLTASGSYWTAVVLKSLPSPASAKNIGVQIVPQVAIPIIVTVAGTESPKVRVLSMEAARESEGGHVSSTALVSNEGNVALMISGAFTVERNRQDGTYEELAESEIGARLSLPGTTLKLAAQLPGSDFGGAQVHAIVRFGPSAQDVVEAATEIKERGASTSPKPASESGPARSSGGASRSDVP